MPILGSPIIHVMDLIEVEQHNFLSVEATPVTQYETPKLQKPTVDKNGYQTIMTNKDTKRQPANYNQRSLRHHDYFACLLKYSEDVLIFSLHSRRTKRKKKGTARNLLTFAL